MAYYQRGERIPLSLSLGDLNARVRDFGAEDVMTIIGKRRRTAVGDFLSYGFGLRSARIEQCDKAIKKQYNAELQQPQPLRMTTLRGGNGSRLYLCCCCFYLKFKEPAARI